MQSDRRSSSKDCIAFGQLVAFPISRQFPQRNPTEPQRGLTAPMKQVGAAAGDYHSMQVWASQPAATAKSVLAGDLVRDL
jgi:hypothetical protein